MLSNMNGITNAPVRRILLRCGNCSSKNLKKRKRRNEKEVRSTLHVTLLQTNSVPGVAGRAGAEDGVGDGDKDEVAMEPTVHPTLGHHVGTVGDGATCVGNQKKTRQS